jgi:hypothetical protein
MTEQDNKEQKVQQFLELNRKNTSGKLKIYIGMSAGVGKTYRMLQEAHTLLKNGINVKVGYIETHGRKETQSLIEGLSIIPRREVFYKGKRLEELDVQAILLLHPNVVIIDELAHTNIAGSKNEKRWQDVMDILQEGIDVISAVNIQHIESINSEVKKITGIEVEERVPDKNDYADKRKPESGKNMFIINSSGPKALQIFFKRFGFTKTFKKVTVNIKNQCVDFLKDFFIFFSPVNVILVGIIYKLDRFHEAFIFNKALDNSVNSSPLKETHSPFPFSESAITFSMRALVSSWVSFRRNFLPGVEKLMTTSFVFMALKYFFNPSINVALSSSVFNRIEFSIK